MKSAFQETFNLFAIRSGLLMGLAALAHGCATPPTLPAPDESPSNEAVISFQRFYKKDQTRFAELTLSNAASHSIWVAAYYSHDPVVQYQYWIRDHWANAGLIACAFEIKAKELPASGHFTFSVPVADLPSIPVRLGVSCSYTSEPWPQKTSDCWMNLPRHW